MRTWHKHINTTFIHPATIIRCACAIELHKDFWNRDNRSTVYSESVNLSLLDILFSIIWRDELAYITRNCGNSATCINCIIYFNISGISSLRQRNIAAKFVHRISSKICSQHMLLQITQTLADIASDIKYSPPIYFCWYLITDGWVCIWNKIENLIKI